MTKDKGIAPAATEAQFLKNELLIVKAFNEVAKKYLATSELNPRILVAAESLYYSTQSSQQQLEKLIDAQEI